MIICRCYKKNIEIVVNIVYNKKKRSWSETMVNTGIQLWTKLKIFINVCRQYFWCKTFLNKSDKYVAFTLAESLIVLGIISVLATLSTLALTNV